MVYLYRCLFDVLVHTSLSCGLAGKLLCAVNIGLGRAVLHGESHKRGKRMEGEEASKEDLSFTSDGLALKWFINA